MKITNAKKTITSGLAVLAVTLGIAATAPVSAQAGNVELYVGHRGAAISVDTYRDRSRRDYRESRRHKVSKYRARSCSPREALYKARRHGVRNAHVDSVGRRFVVIEGRKRYRGKVEMAFYRKSRHCEVAWVKNNRRWR